MAAHARRRVHRRRVAQGWVVLLLAVIVVAWLTRPTLQAGDVVDLEGFGQDRPALQVSMSGHVGLAGEEIRIVDPDTGATSASVGAGEGEQRFWNVQIVQIGEDGTDLVTDDGELFRPWRLTEDGLRRLDVPDEVGGETGLRESTVLATSADQVAVHGCLRGGGAVVAGLDARDLSVRWRHSSEHGRCSTLTDDPTATQRYIVDPLARESRGGRILDTRTGILLEPQVPGWGSERVLPLIHEATAGLLRADGRIVGVDVATGETIWRSRVCRGGGPSWSEGGSGGWSEGSSGESPRAAARYRLLDRGAVDETSQEGRERRQVMVLDLVTGRVGPRISDLSGRSQDYLDGKQRPEPDETTVDDSDRPVGQLMSGGTIITRVGKRVAGSDPFTGRELWVRGLDLDEQNVVTLAAVGTGMVAVTITGDERQETMLWDADEGRTLVHTRGDDQELEVNAQDQVLLRVDPSNGRYPDPYLVRPESG